MHHLFILTLLRTGPFIEEMTNFHFFNSDTVKNLFFVLLCLMDYRGYLRGRKYYLELVIESSAKCTFNIEVGDPRKMP